MRTAAELRRLAPHAKASIVFLFVLSSTAFADPICFDRQQVDAAAERLGMGVGWTGVETNLSPVESAMASPTKTLILFLKDGGATWSLWRLEGEEGCLLGKGTDWEGHPLGRPPLRNE